jgi:hypothetical protein
MDTTIRQCNQMRQYDSLTVGHINYVICINGTVAY